MTHVYVVDDGFYCGHPGCGLPPENPIHPPIEPEPDLPVTPYGGAVPNSGWSGSHTSRERAERRDKDGSTSEVQTTLLGMAALAEDRGVTVREAREATERMGSGWHHGTVSGALSNLHQEGDLARLTERRDRCAVYVLPEHVNGRETAAHGRKRVDEDVRALLGEMGDRLMVEDFHMHMADRSAVLGRMRTQDVHEVLSAYAVWVRDNPDRQRY